MGLSGITVVVPHKREIDIYWPSFKPLIEKALIYSGGEVTADDHKTMWQESQCFFMGFYENGKLLGIASIEIIEFPQKTILNLPIVAGDEIHKWIDDGLDKINQLGLMHGATEMRTRGREGWLRMLKDKEFHHEYTILSRKIT